MNFWPLSLHKIGKPPSYPTLENVHNKSGATSCKEFCDWTMKIKQPGIGILLLALVAATCAAGSPERRLQLTLPFFTALERITGPWFCWIGIDLDGVFDSFLMEALADLGGFEINISLNSCICKDYQLARKLETASIASASPTVIELCAGTMKVGKSIDLTGKAVAFTCTNKAIHACGFSGRGENRIFEGAPVSASFNSIKFENGNAAREIVNLGGAMYITGGFVVAENAGFVNNQAGSGGALYLGSGASAMIPNAEFRSNEATGEGNNPRDPRYQNLGRIRNLKKDDNEPCDEDNYYYKEWDKRDREYKYYDRDGNLCGDTPAASPVMPPTYSPEVRSFVSISRTGSNVPYLYFSPCREEEPSMWKVRWT